MKVQESLESGLPSSSQDAHEQAETLDSVYEENLTQEGLTTSSIEDSK